MICSNPEPIVSNAAEWCTKYVCTWNCTHKMSWKPISSQNLCYLGRKNKIEWAKQINISPFRAEIHMRNRGGCEWICQLHTISVQQNIIWENDVYSKLSLSSQTKVLLKSLVHVAKEEDWVNERDRYTVFPRMQPRSQIEPESTYPSKLKSSSLDFNPLSIWAQVIMDQEIN